jgi:hypothetical protein
MFSSLLESAKVRLIQTTDAYSALNELRQYIKLFRVSKEEKLYVTKRVSPNGFSV